MYYVFIPPQLRSLANGADVAEIDISAPEATILELLQELDRRFPGIHDRLVHNGAIRSGMAVCVNGTTSNRGLKQRVPVGAEVHFLPAIGGG